MESASKEINRMLGRRVGEAVVTTLGRAIQTDSPSADTYAERLEGSEISN